MLQPVPGPAVRARRGAGLEITVDVAERVQPGVGRACSLGFGPEEGRVLDQHGAHAVGEVGGQAHGQEPAGGVTRDDDGSADDVLDEPGQRLGLRQGGVPRRVLLRTAVPERVDGEHVPVTGEGAEDGCVVRPRHLLAVDEQQGSTARGSLAIGDDRSVGCRDRPRAHPAGRESGRLPGVVGEIARGVRRGSGAQSGDARRDPGADAGGRRPVAAHPPNGPCCPRRLR